MKGDRMKKVEIIISNTLKVKGLSNSATKKVYDQLIIDNPKYQENIKHGRSNYKTYPKLTFIKDIKEYLILPRGFIAPLKKILKEEGAKECYIEDKTTSLPCPIKADINLKDYQQIAVDKIVKKRFGVLQAPTGSGKTVIAIETMAIRHEKTLIIVHTKELLHQWRDRILEFTKKEVGLIGDGSMETGKNITVGIINSLHKLKDNQLQFGYVIVDECHRIPSTVFSKFVRKLNTKYMLGLSATPYRRDGLGQVINFFMGNTVHKIGTKQLQDDGHIMKADLKVIETEFNTFVMGTYDYPKVIKELVEDEKRNQLIIREVISQSKKEGIALVISDRKSHCINLYHELGLIISYDKGRIPLLMTGSTPKNMRENIVGILNKKEAKILVATGQLIGEGFDLKHLSSIFICTPLRYEGRLIQYCGRILRKADGKDKATIFDFNDNNCWLLRSSFQNRLKTYKKMGITKQAIIELKEEKE